MYASRTTPARLRAGAVAVLVVGLVGLGAAQSSAQAEPGLHDLSVAWAQGSYGSPLICEMDGEPVRGMRRLQITPAPQPGRPTEAKVIFVKMDVPDGTRCLTDLGEPAPNIIGSVRLRLPGPARKDSASRDFKQMLKRNHGVEFDITSGRLRIEPGPPAPQNFSGGKAFVGVVRPGTDSARLLADFSSPRKLTLELRPKIGESIRLPLFLTDGR